MCVHPGEVKIEVARDLPKLIQTAYMRLFFLLSSEEGARSVLFCATDEEVEALARPRRQDRGGDWDCGRILAYFGPDLRIWPVAKQALDMTKSRLVWDKTLELVNLDHSQFARFLGHSLRK